MCDGLALEEDLALVERVDADDALDERRLAGAVVADERHHLAGADLEVDPVERLHRAERLRDALHSRSGVSAMASSVSAVGRDAVPRPAPRRCLILARVLLAEVGLGDVAGADLLDRAEPVGDHGVGDVVGRHPDRARARSTGPRRRRRRVRRLAVGRVDADESRTRTRSSSSATSSPFTQRERDLGGGRGLGLDRLVDRHGLLAEQDVLDAGRRRVLAADRDRPDACGLAAR